MGVEVRGRYFDDALQAWVTVCRPGSAKGILTAEGFRGSTRSKGRPVAKGAAIERAWEGTGKRARKKRSK